MQIRQCPRQALRAQPDTMREMGSSGIVSLTAMTASMSREVGGTTALVDQAAVKMATSSVSP